MQVERLAGKPATATEWLMAPYSETPDLNEDHRDVVALAVDALPPRLRDALEGFFFERLSYAQIGRRLGVSKTHAWRLVRQATTTLQTQLEHHPTIQRRYKMASWQDAAYVALTKIEQISDRTCHVLNLDELDHLAQSMGYDIRRGMEPLHHDIEEIAVAVIEYMRFMELWDRDSLLDLLARKQADYGHDNINRFGVIGVGVRICDKIARLINLSAKAATTKVSDESFLDTLHDIVGYATIASMLNDQTFNYQLKEAA